MTEIWSRRSLLAAGAAGAAALAVPASAHVVAQRRPSLADPFTLGVASGDPWPASVVLWTRLAVDPLAPDGRGGMPARAYQVQWQLATDERMRNLVRTGTETATPAWGHSVHAIPKGLQPGREYFYRFRVNGHVSPIGRTSTAPSRTSTAPVTMAVASCAQYEHGYFTAYRRLADDAPDVVLHLGDYLYEYEKNDYVIDGGNVRDHAGLETVTLANYRQRHAQYKTDTDLQYAHAAAPWVVTWDDHEVENNWAGAIPEDDQPVGPFVARRRAAFRAYYENMPLRPQSSPVGTDLRLYRRLDWGRTATLHMLDTRQFRDDQACGDGVKVGCEARLDPDRSITGAEQERWLLRGLARSTSVWDVLGQQVFFAKSDYRAGPTEAYNMDAWDGYVASRDRIVAGFDRLRVANPVVLTGDIHSHWANDIKKNFSDQSSRTLGVELVTSSITSGGDGSDSAPFFEATLAENPHIKFASNRRGYIRARFTRDRLRADFRSMPAVSQPGARAYTQASFVVDAGDPGLQRVTAR